MTYDDDSPTRTCPWPNVCRCAHRACVDGWLVGHHEDGTEYARPCPNCRPEVATHLADRTKSLMRRRRELPTLPRPSRTGGRTAREDHAW